LGVRRARTCVRVASLVVSSLIFTVSLCRGAVSLQVLDASPAKIMPMDIVSVLIAVLMFAVLIALIYGIERI
jgi:arginine exporter protein ArgO